MAANNGNGNGNGTHGSLGDYGGGVSATRVGLETTRMLERAVKEQWPIPDDLREAVVKRQMSIATGETSSPREATSAARCLASMNAQNLTAIHKALDKIAPDKHEVTHHEGAQVREVLDQLEADERIQKASRQGADSRYASLVGNGSKPGGMASGTASNGHRQGSNGHHNGKNGHADTGN